MSVRLEDYALIGDTRAAALVSRSGSIDWLAIPRFDSASCFTALLGRPEDGHWSISPTGASTATWQYRGETLVLETTYRTDGGEARVCDCMPVGYPTRTVVRTVEGIAGEVEFRCQFCPMFDYGSLHPWTTVTAQGAVAIGGPDGLVLRASVPLQESEHGANAVFRVRAGEVASFTLAGFPSHHEVAEAIDARAAVAATEQWWTKWSSQCTYRGPYRDAVIRSLILLKALTYTPTGAIVAAATASLPEAIGGVRNWDYRYCWLRDATFTLLALLNAGYRDEAVSFTNFLLRAIAGDPAKLQIMYGVGGERRLEEFELPWLCGYENSRPVRVGNAAFAQFQLDVYGEVIDALYQAVKAGMPPHPHFWKMLRGIIDYVAEHWQYPADHGMWEIRGEPRHFTESKAMAWVCFDRAVKAIEAGAFEGPLVEWREMRDRIHAQILANGYDPERNTFTQFYGSRQLDASLLLLTHIGFLPPDDPRIRGTVEAIERELYREPFVERYSTEPRENVDGLPPGEGAFIACSFWLADNYILTGRYEDGRRLFEKLLALRTDLGLLSEEFDVRAGRQVGNTPQAFSHLALVNTAYNLAAYDGPALQRAQDAETPATGATA